MSTKLPSRIRRDLDAARNRVRILVEVLRQNQMERRWGLGEECSKAIERLQTLLNENQAPPEYKVAIVGRFKAGKSTFVNVLLDRRLAGVDTSPETAAVTTFRAGGQVVARIKLVDKSSWEELKGFYQDDATDPAAHRIANWYRLGREPRGGSSTQTETFDLTQLEEQFVRPGGYTLNIALPVAQSKDTQRKVESEFQRSIKQFTSSTKPHHCLVESIEIETPSVLLGEGVVLVDTPGLDDTERYRVQLTERAVQDVDAVLFLTKSGASYGQSEKDFILSLLRKGTIKQLVFVVTQVDQTYEQHVRQTRDLDEDPEPISSRIELERARLRAEIEATLGELAVESGSASVERYRDQLNTVEISFISAANHLDFLRKDPIRFPIALGDPGGMSEIKQNLYRILSTESRLAATKQAINDSVASILGDMLDVIERRRAVVAGLKSKEVAESKLITFRSEFEAIGGQFSEITRQDGNILQTTLANRSELEGHVAEVVALQADEVLASYEIDDAARHWATRRGGRWGHMHELQTRIANRIFPKVAAELNKQTDAFAEFVEKFRVHLQTLSNGASDAIARLEMGEELQFDIGADLEKFLEEALGSLQQIVEGEETQIVALLEGFVDDQVEDRIAAARDKVSAIWGRGTTVAQTAEVRRFYADVRSILKDALRTHVRKRFEEFGRHLTDHARAIPDRTLSEVQTQIERTATNIRAAAEAMLAGEKGAFEKISAGLADAIAGAREEIAALLEDEVRSTSPDDGPVAVLQEPVVPQQSVEGGLASIQVRATHCVHRHSLQNGAKGWPWSRIAPAQYLRGATQGWLIDPFLAMRHQRRNLNEFIVALLDGAKLKSLHVITRMVSDEGEDADRHYFDGLDRDTFEKAGMRVTYKIDPEIHDRSFTLDNGIVFKLGRGLDIYKPVAGLASRDSSLRQVRQCEIDIFGSPSP